MRGLLAPTLKSVNQDYGCHSAGSGPGGSGITDTIYDSLTPYGTIVVPLTTIFKISDLNAPVKGTVIGNPQPPYPFNMTMITCVDFNITIGSSTQEIQLCDVVMTPHVFNGIIQNPNTAAVISTQQGTIE